MDSYAYDVKEYKADKAGLTQYRNDLRWAAQNGWRLVSVVPVSDTFAFPGTTTALWATFEKVTPAPAAQHDAADDAPPRQYALRR